MVLPVWVADDDIATANGIISFAFVMTKYATANDVVTFAFVVTGYPLDIKYVDE